MKLSSLLLLILAMPPAGAAERGEEIPLWVNGAPGSEGLTKADEVSRPSTNARYGKLPGNYTVSHVPAIFVFLPAKEKATGAAMIVAPGGGHTQLVIEKEGWEIADWLNARGIAAFVLKYRLAKAPASKYTLPEHVYADAARAVRLVRTRAAEFKVNPARIGFIGFSAGGEVAGMIETKFDPGRAHSEDPVERASSRPDFTVFVYPWYRPGVFGAAPDAAPLFPIPSDAPPVFMVCTDEDRAHVEPTVKFYLELEAARIPAEMHIYQAGPHGFALRPAKPVLPVSGWADRLVEWMSARGILK
jgi:acetyl esterase/lipase